MNSETNEDDIKVLKDVVQTLDPESKVFKLTSIELDANSKLEEKE